MPKKLTLTPGERLTLLEIIPKEGNYITMKALNGIINELGFSDDEAYIIQENLKKLSDSQRQSGLLDLTGITSLEVTFSDFIIGIIIEALKKLDMEQKIRGIHVILWEKFDINTPVV